MEKFTLQPIFPGSENEFSKGIYILLFNATSLPPHLLLSINGKIYSITDSGRQMGSPLEKLLTFINRKNVPALFIEWKLPPAWTNEQFEQATKAHFSKYEKVVEGKVSCLFPIRDLAAEVLNSEMQNAGFIFQLLPMMQHSNALGKNFALNMQDAIENNSFELLTYTNEQMKEALQVSQQSAVSSRQ